MHPRHLTGLPRDFCSGVRLAALAAEASRFFVTILLLLVSSLAFGAGNVMQYTYDAAGNIIGIQRTSGPPVSISGFSPTSGPAGTSVTITGAGFNATPANNAVMFNGTAASISSSSATSISTTVPTGATTGRIQVTVAGVTATSAQDFVVTTPGAPIITSFTPTTGASGTSVSVTGTNFDTAGTTVKLNGVTATSSTSSTTALSFTVPGAAASARITATTSVGTGSSAADFIVPPPGITAASIATTLRISAGSGNAHVTVPTGSKSAVVLFDGTANTYYTLQFASFGTSPTTGSVTYQVVKPDNTVLQSGSISMGSAKSIRLPALPSTGTYTLTLAPGNATLDTQVRLEADPTLVLDGSAVSIYQDYPIQTSRFILTATAGQRIGVGAQSIAFHPTATGAMTFQVTRSDGTNVTFIGCSSSNCGLQFVAPVTGTYFVTVGSPGGIYTTGSVLTSSPSSGALTADTSQAVAISRVGQDASYTLSVASGDSYGIDISSGSMTPTSTSFSVAVFNPGGTQIASTSGASTANTYLELGTLSTAGTYTVTVDATSGATGTFKITAKQGPLMLATDNPVAFAPPGIAESARFRFAATAGQNFSFGISGITDTAGSGGSSLSVYNPSAAPGIGANCSPSFPGGDCHAIVTNAVAGTYSAVVRPQVGTSVSGSALVSGELTGTLTAGTWQAVNVTRVGQIARLSFAGTSGDSTSLKAMGVTTTPSGQSLSVTVFRPDGVAYVSGNVGSSIFINMPSLPQTGTYTFTVDSNQGVPWSGSLLLDPGALLTVDGSTVSLASSNPGEPMRFRVAVTAGQRLDFGISGITYNTSTLAATSFNLYDLAGNNAGSTTCSPPPISTGCEFEASSISTTGTYSVVLTPPSGVSITAGTLAISTPQAGTFNIGDPAQGISLTRPGQNARYTFSGTSGQTLRLNWSSVTLSGGASVAVSVLNPSGGTVSTGSFSNGASGGMDIAALPSTGTYTIVLDPSLAQTMSASVSLVTR